MNDREALGWAQANPDDERAKQVLAYFERNDPGILMKSWDPEHPPEARPDQMGHANKTTGAVAKGGLAMGGAMLGGPAGGALGAAAGNVLGGYIDRGLNGPDGTGPVSDALWGAVPQAAPWAAGKVMRSYGKPGLAKAVGYLMGKPTQQAVAEGGPAMPHVTNRGLERITAAETPEGANAIGSEMAKKTRAEVPEAMYGEPSVTTQEIGINAKGNPTIGDMSTQLPKPSFGRTGMIADEAGELEKFAAPSSPLSSSVDAFLSMANGPGHIASRALGTMDPRAARYLSAVAQAKQRGLMVVPELEKMLQNMPGQHEAMPALGGAVRGFMQNGDQ